MHVQMWDYRAPETDGRHKGGALAYNVCIVRCVT